MGNRQSSKRSKRIQPSAFDQFEEVSRANILDKSSSSTLSASLDYTHVFSLGQCDKGQLGRGIFKEDDCEAHPLGPITELHYDSQHMSELNGMERLHMDSKVLMDIKSVAAGRSHFLIVTNSNKLYGSGFNNYAQLGISEQEQYITRFREIKLPENVNTIDHVAAGWFHSIVVCDKNKVFSAGHCYFGQTFNVPQEGGFRRASKLDFLQRDGSHVTQASAATFSSSLLVDGWKIYACGEMDGNSNGNYLVPGCEIFKRETIKTFKHADKGLVVVSESGSVFFSDKTTPFRMILNNCLSFVPSHMYDTTFFLTKKSKSLTECQLGPLTCRSHVEINALAEKYGIENIQIFCGYCFYYLAVNKKRLYSINGSELKEIMNLEGISTQVSIKDVVSSSDCTYIVFEKNGSTVSEKMMKTRMLTNDRFADMAIRTQTEELNQWSC